MSSSSYRVPESGVEAFDGVFEEFISRSGLPEADIRTLRNRDIDERPRVEF